MPGETVENLGILKKRRYSDVFAVFSDFSTKISVWKTYVKYDGFYTGFF